MREPCPAVLAGSRPIGVVLAGGRGRRLGGDKAAVHLNGRPLAQWVVDALRGALDQVVVACRMDTDLPPLTGVAEAWVEDRRSPEGPVAGLGAALRAAGGRTVIVCAVSLPLVTSRTVEALLAADAAGAPAVVPEVEGRLEPLLGRWEPRAARALRRLPPDASLEAAVHACRGARLVLPDETAAEFTRVIAPEDVLQASALLGMRRVGA